MVEESEVEALREEMRRTVAEFLDAEAGSQQRRVAMAEPAGFDRALHERACADLGLGALAVPEELGGLGLGFGEIAVVLGEFGRRVVPSPLPGTLVATAVLAERLAAAGDAGCAPAERVLTRAAEEPLVLATALPAGRQGGRADQVTARDGSLTGSLTTVPFGAAADALLVPAVDEGSDGDLALYLVPGDGPGVTRTARSGLDHTRRYADVTLDAAAAERISPAADGGALAGRLRDLTRIALAVESVAAAQECLELTVEYLTVRRQFGRPIGSFQALKHRCADLALAVHGARATAEYAVRFAAECGPGERDELGDDLGTVAALAKCTAADTLMTVAAEGLQLHGGIGFTFEHDLHLYLKRGKSNQLLAGSGPALRAQLAERLAAA